MKKSYKLVVEEVKHVVASPFNDYTRNHLYSLKNKLEVIIASMDKNYDNYFVSNHAEYLGYADSQRVKYVRNHLEKIRKEVDDLEFLLDNLEARL